MKPTSESLGKSAPPLGDSTAGHTLNRADVLPLTLLVGSLVAMFWKVLFTPVMFFYRDVFNYSYPHARFIQEVCRQATLPYWNPYLNYGEPVLANPNFLFFYPSTIILILLPIDLAYTLHYVVHFALAAAGAYALGRRWGQSRVAAFFAAFVFGFSGPILSLGSFYNHAACAAWIPWALLLTDRAVGSSSLRPWLLLTVVFSLQFLASEPFTLLATFALSLALALHRGGALHRPPARAHRVILIQFFLVGCLMAALCAIQLVPSLDLLQNSRRGGQGLPYTETSTWPFHPLSLLELVLPDFFAQPFTVPSLWTTVLNGRNLPYFPSVFVGFVPLFFAVVGWARGRSPRRTFVAGAALIFLLLSFGRLTPVFALAYLLVPPLELVRFPVKLLIPAVLLAALLAGWGLDALCDHEVKTTRWGWGILRLLQGLLAATGLIWLVSCLFPGWIAPPASWILRHTNDLFLRIPQQDRLRPEQLAAATEYFVSMLRYNLPSLAGLLLGAIILLLALERGKLAARRAVPIVAALALTQMAWVNSAANPTVSKLFYTYRPSFLPQGEDSRRPFRFCSMYRGPLTPDQASELENFLNFDSIPGAGDFSPLAQASFRNRLLLERGSMLANVETSLNVDIERSLPPYIYEFWVFALRQTPDPARTDCLIGRTNVKYLVLPAHLANATAREVTPVFNGSPQPSFLYEDRCYLPRAYVVSRALRLTDALRTLTQLADPDFDARREVLLYADPKTTPPGEDSDDAGEVSILNRSPNATSLRAKLRRTGYIVLLDRFDPNWHAMLDGREVPILRANQIFRAIEAGPGEHEVRFDYHPQGLRIGLIISLITLAALGLGWAANPEV